MRPTTQGRVLMAIGAFLLLFAQFYDITVATGLGDLRVANIHRMNERQTLLIVGGILFLAGVILFATARMREKPEQKSLKSGEQSDRWKAEVREGVTAVSNALQEPIGEVTGALKARGGARGILIRAAAGLYVTMSALICFFVSSDGYDVSAGVRLLVFNLLLLAPGGYALIRRSPAVVKHILWANVLFCIGLAAIFRPGLVLLYGLAPSLAFLALIWERSKKAGEKA